jgi:isopentenyl diphosphate isomerase/L-lactate dehydrogenase-like FMN-dependent dehydrogenase
MLALQVGISWPFLYALSTYGTDGVDRALQILRVYTHPTTLVDGSNRLSE